MKTVFDKLNEQCQAILGIAMTRKCGLKARAFLLGAMVCTLGMMTSCGIPYDGEHIIHPSNEMQTDTLVAVDTTSEPNRAEISLKGYTKDTLYLSFSDGCFWKVKLIGNIDTTYSSEWYDEYLPVSYYTKASNDGDSVVIKYWIN